MFPYPTFEHSPEHGFLCLPRWIWKTSDLIENPSKMRDMLSRLTHKEVWHILDFSFFVLYQSFAHYVFLVDLRSLVAGEDELVH